MRIAFLTGCLEPSRDGVGDYTRILASECLKQGHQTCLISINDGFITAPLKSDADSSAVSGPQLRLPKTMPWSKRFEEAKVFLHSFKPDIVSIQFVPYAFQKRGVLAGLISQFMTLTAGFKVHLMVHELWIGQYKGAKLKERLIGAVQRYFILRLIHRIQPQIIHAAASAYLALLGSYHIYARRLPLFGSIPIQKGDGGGWFYQEMQEKGLDIDHQKRGQFWLFGLFGTLHPNWQTEPMFTYLEEAGVKNHRQIVIISIGNLRSGDRLWDELASKYSPKIKFLKLGERSAEKISQFFNSIDYGLTSVPWNIIEKSASVASMLEHGLPVLVNQEGAPLTVKTQDSEGPDPLLHKVGPDLPDMISRFSRGSCSARVHEIAERFISALAKVSRT